MQAGNNRIEKTLAGFALLALVQPAQAAFFDCTTTPGLCVAEGDTVIFQYVDNQPEMAAYGTLEVIGDTVFSNPTGFRAESNDGVGVHSGTPTDSSWAVGTVQVIAKPGYKFTGFQVGEIGDYRMKGTDVAVDVDGWFRVAEYGGLAGIDPSITTDLTITGDLSIVDNDVHEWQGSASIDVTSPIWDGVDHIGMTLQNNLSAYSLNDGDSAWIQKKGVGTRINMKVETTTVVPVPAAVWLFGSGLLGLVGIARRRAG
ncbi:MAG: hypothetical protein CMN57_12085 [Gammaproteobacteria bacterium]|nr:hypothetical protein [Gammaproteobacteria bacterium]